MDYRNLGRAGVRVSPLCLGCMNFGGPTPEDEAIRIVHRALDAGVNFLDTADVYNGGRSEEIVGKAIRGRRHQVVLATKVHGRTGEGPNDRGNSRYHIMQAVDESLRRLGTDHIDLYQLHRPDPSTPIDETLSALTDLVRRGKVRYLGTSTFPAWRIMEALWTADRLGLERPVCEQPPYSILDRRVETEVLPLAKQYGMAVIPWSPLAGGFLTGKYERGRPAPEGSRVARRGIDLAAPAAQRRFEVVDGLRALASAHGVPLSQFALAWVMAQDGVTAPIIGPRTMEHLEDNLAALDVRVSPDDLAAVDRLMPPGTAA